MAHRTSRIAIAALAFALGMVGFAGGTAGAAKAKATVKTATVPGVGTILVDANGHALYTLTDGSGAAVACTGGCLSAWPPLVVTGKVTPAKGVKSLSKTKDTNQVTSAGLPLYLFAGDTAARQANGEGINSFGGTWHVVKAKATTAKSTVTTKGTSGYSGY